MIRRFRTAALVTAVVAMAAVLLHDTRVIAADTSQPVNCTRQTLGISTCFGPKLCLCIYDRGGAGSGVPAGFRWDCGVLRPRCDPSGPPATLDPYRGPFPHAVGIDRSDRRVTVDQDTQITVPREDD